MKYLLLSILLFPMKYLLLSILLFPTILFSTNYYIDGLKGNDGNDGLGMSTPWLTIGEATDGTPVLAAGDTIFIRTDGTYREQLTVPSSGSAGLPITFTSYDSTGESGAKPVISGADTLMVWVNSSVRPDNPIFADDLETGDYAAGWIQKQGVCDTYANFSIDGPTGGGTYGVYLNAAADQDIYKFSSTSDEAWVDIDVRKGNADGTRTYILNITEVNYDDICQIMFNSTDKKIRAWVNGESAAYLGAAAYNADTWFHVKVHLFCHDTEGVLRVWVDGSLQINLSGIDTEDGVQTVGAIKVGGTSSDQVHYYDNIGVYYYDLDEAIPDSIWEKTGIVTAPVTLLYDGSVGKYEFNIDSLDNTGDWYYSGGDSILYIYSLTDPDTTFMDTGVEINQRNFGIYCAKDYVTFDNLELRGAKYDGVAITAVDQSISSITFSNIESYGNGQMGIGLQNEGAANNISGVSVTDCILHHNGLSGFRASTVTAGTISDLTINDNTIYNNCWRWDVLDRAGISLYKVASSTISGNTVYSNGEWLPYFQDATSKKRTGHGIQADSVYSNVVIEKNLFYNNNHSQLLVEISDSARVSYNVIYGNLGSSGMLIWSWGGISITDCFIYNNTSYGNAIGLSVWGEDGAGSITGHLVKNNILSGNTMALYAANGGENDGTNGSGNVYINNCLGPEAANFITWGAATPDTYDAWETAYGATTNSVESDPLFTDAANGDFTLQVSSPCINAGTSVGLTVDYLGITVPLPAGTNPDIGAYEYNQSAGIATNTFERTLNRIFNRIFQRKF